MRRIDSPLQRLPFFRVFPVLMAFIALFWLSYEFWRLLVQVGEMGAIDLKNRHAEISCWFSGINPYRAKGTAMYPPASYLLLWPLLGWLKFSAARWLWAATSLVSLGGLVFLTQKYSLDRTHTGKLFWVILPLAIYPTGATIGNGQLPLHILPALIPGMFLVQRKQLSSDLTAGFLFLFGMIKPTLSAPFFWILLFKPERFRPAVIVVAGYLLLTISAAAFVPDSPAQLMDDWLQSSLNGADFGTRQIEKSLTDATHSTSAEAHWLSEALNRFMRKSQLHGLNFPVAICGFFLLGLWTWFYRKIDLWVLMGVAALFARFWTYHMWYDDLLILIPMVTLYRLAGADFLSETWRRRAFALFVLSLPLMIAPGGLYLLPLPWNTLYVLAQKLLWVSMSGYLLLVAEKIRQSPEALSIPLPEQQQKGDIPAHEKPVYSDHPHP